MESSSDVITSSSGEVGFIHPESKEQYPPPSNITNSMHQQPESSLSQPIIEPVSYNNIIPPEKFPVDSTLQQQQPSILAAATPPSPPVTTTTSEIVPPSTTNQQQLQQHPPYNYPYPNYHQQQQIPSAPYQPQQQFSYPPPPPISSQTPYYSSPLTTSYTNTNTTTMPYNNLSYYNQQPSYQDPNIQQRYPYYSPDGMPVGNEYYNNDENDDAILLVDVPKVTAWIAVGSILGLTAAAAVRWLNGGDFILFPPAYNTIASKQQQQRRPQQSVGDPSQKEEEGRFQIIDSSDEDENDDNEQQELEQHDYIDVLQTINDDGVEEGSDDDGEEENEEVEDEQKLYNQENFVLLNEVKGLIETVQSQGERQEKLLQRFVSSQERTITDQSINLLRKQQQQEQLKTNDTSRQQLEEVKVNLSSLYQEISKIDSLGIDKNNDEFTATTRKWDSTLLSAIQKLEIVLQSMNGNVKITATSTTVESSRTVEEEINKSKNVLSTSTQEPDMTKTIITSLSNDTVGITLETNDELPKTDDDQQFLSSSKPLAIPLIEAIQMIITTNHDLPALKGGAQLMYLYVYNLSNHPALPRYRKIYTSNETFQKQVDIIQGGRLLLYAVGFVERGSGKNKLLEWDPCSCYKSYNDSSNSHDNLDSKEIEDVYVELLKKAAIALKTIQSISIHEFENNNNSVDNDQRKGRVLLLQSLLSAADLTATKQDNEKVICNGGFQSESIENTTPLVSQNQYSTQESSDFVSTSLLSGNISDLMLTNDVVTTISEQCTDGSSAADIFITEKIESTSEAVVSSTRFSSSLETTAFSPTQNQMKATGNHDDDGEQVRDGDITLSDEQTDVMWK